MILDRATASTRGFLAAIMRNTVIQKTLLFLTIFIWSCNRPTEIVYSRHENGQVDEVLILDKPITVDSIGIKKYFFENGDIKCIGGYKGGQRHGEWTCYYPNRDVEWQATYKDGLENGETFCNYLDGSWKRVHHVNGKKEGKTTEYNLDTLNNIYFYIHGQYVNDKEDGLWTRTDTNKVVRVEMTFKEGKGLGYIANYYSNGKIKIKGNLNEEGQVLNIEYFDENGNRQVLEYYEISII